MNTVQAFGRLIIFPNLSSEINLQLKSSNLKLESLILNIHENFLSHVCFGILISGCVIYWCMKGDCNYSLLCVMSVCLVSSSVPKLESSLLMISLSTGSPDLNPMFTELVHVRTRTRLMHCSVQVVIFPCPPKSCVLQLQASESA